MKNWPVRRATVRGRTIRVLAAVLGILVLAAPVTAQSSISQDDELAVGRAVAADLISQYGVFADAEWQGFLAQIRDRLVPFSGRPNIPYKVIILDTPIPNAISTPGYILVTRGMLRLSLDAEEWAFVLGHEMTHTARRHVAQFIERANAGTLLSIFVAIVTGNRTTVDLLRLMLDLATLGFSRDKETEADLGALRMMVEAGFDPAKAAQTLAWLNSATGRSQEQTHWAGTHPGFLDRINAVNAAYAAFAAKRLPLRAWYFKDRREADGVIVTPTKLVEVSDAWSLALTVHNAADTTATIFAGSAALSGPDGDLPVRFLRSTLPAEVEPQGEVEGTLTFDKRSRTPPAALLLPVLFSDRRTDLNVPLTGGGPYTPEPSPTPLPTPPPIP